MPTSTDRLADFIANEAMKRYDLPGAPTHLLDWDPSVIDDGQEVHWVDMGFISLRSPSRPDTAWKERRSSLIQLLCSRFTRIIEEQGREELDLLQRTMKQRLEEEKRRQRRHKMLMRYRELLINKMCNPRIKQGSDKIEWKAVDPKEEVICPHPEPPEGFTLSLYHIAGGHQGVQVKVSDEMLEQYQIDADVLPARATKITSGSERMAVETYSFISQRVKERFAPYICAKRSSQEVCSLLRFRSALLKQYMWAYDVYGMPPNLADTLVVPENIKSCSVRLRRAVTALHVLQECRQDNVAVSSQADLIRAIGERTTIEEREVSAEAVVKGAKRLINDMPGAEATGGLVESLWSHRGRLFLYADETGVCIPD